MTLESIRVPTALQILTLIYAFTWYGTTMFPMLLEKLKDPTFLQENLHSKLVTKACGSYWF